jgi:small multidrug resistance pump
MSYVFLAIAIVSEVVATLSLKACDGFTQWWPSLFVIFGYGSALLFLSLTLRTIPVGISYAIWGGLGTAFVAILGAVMLRQPLDAAAMLGIGLIVAGVVLIGAYSNSVLD